MSHIHTIRAWKDEEYRSSLTDAETAQLAENPAGLIVLSEAQMSVVSGGLMAQSVYRGCTWLDAEIYCGR